MKGLAGQNLQKAYNQDYLQNANLPPFVMNQKARCKSQFRDSEPQGIRISSKQQPTNKLISASPASNFISAKDKASAHRNYIDNKNKAQDASDYTTLNDKASPNNLIKKFESDDEDEEDLISQMMVVRKINLHEPSRL